MYNLWPKAKSDVEIPYGTRGNTLRYKIHRRLHHVRLDWIKVKLKLIQSNSQKETSREHALLIPFIQWSRHVIGEIAIIELHYGSHGSEDELSQEVRHFTRVWLCCFYIYPNDHTKDSYSGVILVICCRVQSHKRGYKTLFQSLFPLVHY